MKGGPVTEDSNVETEVKTHGEVEAVPQDKDEDAVSSQKQNGK